MISSRWLKEDFFLEMAQNCTKLPIIPLKIWVAPRFE